VHGAAERFSAIQITPAALAYGFGAPPRVALPIAILIALAAVVAALLIGVRVRDGFARFAAWSALAPFASLFWHEHDLLVAFPATVWLAQRATAPMRAMALFGTLLVAVDWLGLAQRPTGIVQSALLAAAAWCGFCALAPRGAPRAMGATALLAALFAGAAALASVRPVPVWPAAMGAIHAGNGANAATIWLAEQRATGLFAQVPAWALLRGLSLLGCALLAYAIYRHSASDRTA
jgi:hypothetical protein